MKTEFPRTIPLAQDSLTSIDLPVFADASIADNCSPKIVAVVYTVVYQPNLVSQFLVTKKSRISNHNITIPRPELVSTSMGANLVQNGKAALESQNMRSVSGCTGSTVVLYWLNKKGNCKQFVVRNIVKKIRKRHLPIGIMFPLKKPADIGSRGSLIVYISRVWWEDHSWLPDKTKWPDQTFITSTTASEKETKHVKELVTKTIQSNQKSECNYLISKHDLHKTLAILAWIYGFINNRRKVKKSGPLTTDEIERKRNPANISKSDQSFFKQNPTSNF